MEFLKPRDLTVVKRFSQLEVGQIYYPIASPDGRYLFAPAVLDGIVLVLDVLTGRVLHRLATGSPLLLAIGDSKTIWVSNVLVPPSMLAPGATHRLGGVTRLNLDAFEITHIPGILDANGLAVSPVPLTRPPL